MRQSKNCSRRSSSVIPKKMDSAVVLFEDVKGKEKGNDEYDSFLCDNDNVIDHPLKKDKICHFDKIPLEIKVKIFKCLEIDEIVRISLVCHGWHELAYDGSLWSELNLVSFYRTISADQILRLSKAAGGFLKVANFRGCVQLSSPHLKELAPYCPNIQTLQLSGCRNLDKDSINTLLSHLNNLEVLDLSGLIVVINLTCNTLSKKCKKLKQVNLNWCQNISSRGIENLVKGCQELICLKINGLSKVSEQMMINIASLPNLKDLSMKLCPTLNDEHISTFFNNQSLPSSLTHIDLSNNQLLTDDTLKELGNSCPDLTHLQVNECTNFTDNGFIYISSKCTKLEVIDLEDCPCINDEVLRSFAAYLSDLKKICLSYCELITDDGVNTLLQQCTKISHIDLDHCQLLTDAVLHNLSLLLNEGRVDYMEVEIYDCRNISISAVRETVKKATDYGVLLKLKGYYSWQANSNTDSDDDDNRGRNGGSSWVRNNRFIRRFTSTNGVSLRSHLGAAIRSSIRSTNRDNNRVGRMNFTVRGGRSCIIL
ncbi:14951_t:CDS:2 [Dentiscutata erythropus]|uniref:14951_t:CDS:1 n=1 Tax=Dentiscutata erythropus TaxID=1348616 RepID=A0A9N9HN03_9GLOM|nr:14951_t:CDS:2 [Dentiscutata erythropus]